MVRPDTYGLASVCWLTAAWLRAIVAKLVGINNLSFGGVGNCEVPFAGPFAACVMVCRGSSAQTAPLARDQIECTHKRKLHA
jgi:hypothetical protein